jgi:hypothetical protein
LYAFLRRSRIFFPVIEYSIVEKYICPSLENKIAVLREENPMTEEQTKKSPYEDWLSVNICPKIASLTLAETVRPPKAGEKK